MKPICRSATLAVRNHDESFRGKGKDSKGTQRSKSGKSGRKTREAEARVVARITSKVREIL